jgi:hypothetical protein
MRKKTNMGAFAVHFPLYYDLAFNAYIPVQAMGRELLNELQPDEVIEMPMCECGCQGVQRVVRFERFSELIREQKEKRLVFNVPLTV